MTASLKTFTAAPGDVLPYTINAQLPTGDTISSATWTITTGATLGATSNTAASVTAWVTAGGASITPVVATVAAVTAAGRTYHWNIAILIQ